MKKKKILILCGSLKIGGAEKVAQAIALQAPADTFEFHYITFDPQIGAYEAALREIGCTIHRMEEPSADYVKAFRTLYRLMKQEQFHAVHAHTMFSCGWMMLCARLAGVPVRISHAHSALITEKSLLKTLYEAVMQLLILTCSTELAACGVKAGNRLFGSAAFGKRGTLILNGICTEEFRFSDDRRSLVRQQLHLCGTRVIGHVGHLSQVKNQAFLIRLMPRILSLCPNARLLLLGDGEDRPMLEGLIHRLQLEEQVILTGNVSNVGDYLSAMDVFVFPSLFEGMPLSLLEVQANGLPCVVSDSVPEDVYLTDLIHPLSLSAPGEDWIRQILSLQRSDPLHYSRLLSDSDFSTHRSMEKIYQLYRKGF